MLAALRRALGIHVQHNCVHVHRGASGPVKVTRRKSEQGAIHGRE
jgi:hypothetical protein